MIHLLIFVFSLLSSSSANQPQVSWSCIGGNLIVDLTTDSSFDGRITVGECTVNGTSSRNTQLIVPFVDFDRCGISYDRSRSSFSSPVSIHFHRALILDSDLSMNVSCFENSPDYSLSLSNSREDLVKKAVFGDLYHLKILHRQKRTSNQMQILSCSVYGKTKSIQLISNCKRMMKSNSVLEQSAIFTFDKMFRMSDSPSRMFIECQYRLCDEECSNNCSSTSIPSGSITTLIDVVDGEPATIRAVSSSSIREVSSSSLSFILNFLLFLLTLSTCIGASLVTLIILTRLRAFVKAKESTVCDRREDLWISAGPVPSLSPSIRHFNSPIYSNIITTYH